MKIARACSNGLQDPEVNPWTKDLINPDLGEAPCFSFSPFNTLRDKVKICDLRCFRSSSVLGGAGLEQTRMRTSGGDQATGSPGRRETRIAAHRSAETLHPSTTAALLHPAGPPDASHCVKLMQFDFICKQFNRIYSQVFETHPYLRTRSIA